MNISVFGLGYVGCVSATCLASTGHRVIGVDVNPVKVDMVIAGQSPIVEPRLAALICEAVKKGQLLATTRANEAVTESDISLVCVGTPSVGNGSLDLQYVKRIAADIGEALRTKRGYHTVVFRSTMLPGSTESVVLPILESTSGKCTGKDFGLVYNPEFLREGTAVDDFRNPPRTVIGEWSRNSGDPVVELYADVAAPLVRTNPRTAEMVKYADNAFHALKIAFSNEIGALCREVSIDSHHLMDIFCLDTKLNLSAAYLRPGFAFGGACLPKDMRALTYLARSSDISVPILDTVLRSNEEHKRRALELIIAQGKKRIGFLGLSFKENTDDLRESPVVELIERLIGKGYEVSIYDQNVSLARLIGANKAYIERELPHVTSLMLPTLDAVLNEAEIVVITNRSPEFLSAASRLRHDQCLVDLVRLVQNGNGPKGQYETLVG